MLQKFSENFTCDILHFKSTLSIQLWNNKHLSSLFVYLTFQLCIAHILDRVALVINKVITRSVDIDVFRHKIFSVSIYHIICQCSEKIV